MQRVSTTDFFTHCCIKPPGERRMVRSIVCWVLAWLCMLAGPLQVQAQSHASKVTDLRLERADDGVYLSASLQLALPELAEDALYKGIPIFFVVEAQVLRERWYWSDRQVATATRHLRLNYQPLTRRWRLSTSCRFPTPGWGWRWDRILTTCAMPCRPCSGFRAGRLRRMVKLTQMLCTPSISGFGWT